MYCSLAGFGCKELDSRLTKPFSGKNHHLSSEEMEKLVMISQIWSY